MQNNENSKTEKYGKPCWSKGERILRDPSLNRDLAFTYEQRAYLGILGILPPAVLSMEQQVESELEHLEAKSDPVEKYLGLTALLARNETLFYRLAIENLEEILPIMYTPTVGKVCQDYSHIYRRPRGLFITPDDRGHIAERLYSECHHDIRLLVVTDNERILGLGDLGAGGIGIPIGKLILYSAGAGIHPSHCLPVSLDVGTDNAQLLEDPSYLGYRGRRLRGEEYESFIEEFVQAVRKVMPLALLQWEDFKKVNAFNLLDRYANRLPSFNDDIQGTAGVTLAGVLAGLRSIGSELKDQKFLMYGSGGAGVGIGRLLRTALLKSGVTEQDLAQHILFLDSRGVIHDGRKNLDEHKQEMAWSSSDMEKAGFGATPPTALDEIIEAFKPSVLIGTTGQPGTFTPKAIRTMATHCERPLIFPLSNPTSMTECTPTEAIHNSDGRALVATGSPFAPVTFDGKTHVIGQCNNVFIFPGVGLGLLVSEATNVSNTQFFVAAQALADFTVTHEGWDGGLFPSIDHLREISRKIAIDVAKQARDEGCGRAMSDQQIVEEIDNFIWEPVYPDLPDLSKCSSSC